MFPSPASRAEHERMAKKQKIAVKVVAARIPDRDRLLGYLEEAGLDARARGEVGIEVRAAKGEEQAVSGEVYGHVEDVIMDVGETFVPIKHKGVVYLRPPSG